MCVVQQRKVLNAIETMKSMIIGLNPAHVQGKLASSVYVISASPVAWQRRASVHDTSLYSGDTFSLITLSGPVNLA